MTDEFVSRLEQAKAARRETVAKFRFEQVKELPEPLPVSGMSVFVRNVTMMDLIFTGTLPEPLMDVIQELQKSGSDEIDLKKIARNGAEFRSMVDALVIIAVVEPPIAEKGDEEHIGINEMAGDDKMAIFNWINREVKAMRSFREQDKSVEALQPLDSIQQASE
jgi:hypothetical protein